MTKLGAREKCSNISLGDDDNTNNENALTLLSKDQIFYSFMIESLGLEVVCENNTSIKKGISNKEICGSRSPLKALMLRIYEGLPVNRTHLAMTQGSHGTDVIGIAFCQNEVPDIFVNMPVVKCTTL